MSKTLLFRMLIGLSLLVAAVFWLLSVVNVLPEIEYGTVGQWVALVITAGVGTAFLLRGLFQKNSIPFIQRLWVFFGIGILVVSALILVEIFVWEVPVMPIVAVAVATALLISLIAVGGRRWDMGDNEKVNSQPAYKETEWEKRQKQNRR